MAGTKCTCAKGAQRWVVITRNGNYSKFNGSRFSPSDYSQCGCMGCWVHWRTKAGYVPDLPDAPMDYCAQEDAAHKATMEAQQAECRRLDPPGPSYIIRASNSQWHYHSTTEVAGAPIYVWTTGTVGRSWLYTLQRPYSERPRWPFGAPVISWAEILYTNRPEGATADELATFATLGGNK